LNGKQLKLLKELFENLIKTLNLRYNIIAELVLWNIEHINKSSIKDKTAKSFIINGKNFSDNHNINFSKINNDRQIYNKYNNEKMKTWFTVILNKMNKYHYLFNKKRNLSLPDFKSNVNHKKERSKSITLIPDFKKIAYFDDHREILFKESKINEKKLNTIQKNKEFLILWEQQRITKNPNTKIFKKNEEKYNKLKLIFDIGKLS
jgi:hypothetical protein